MINEALKRAKKKYYDTKVRPFRKRGEIHIRHQCLFCGMMMGREQFKRDFSTIAYRYRGSKIEALKDYDKSMQFFQSMCRRSLKLLNIGIKKNFITKEEIMTSLELIEEIKDLHKNMLNTYNIPHITSSINAKVDRAEVRTYGKD